MCRLFGQTPPKTQLLVKAGTSRFDVGDEEAAKEFFDRAYELDKRLVVGMDTYARLLVDFDDDVRGGDVIVAVAEGDM